MGRGPSIEARKNATDAKRGKIFTKIIREIGVAARAGGGDPANNPRLRVAVGVVAGNRPRGIGGWFVRMDDASDGTVTVAETRLPGLAAHCVVPASHTGLVFSADAARQAAHFLREGRFDHATAAPTV